ncbi:hypothetical protein [Chthoniobacter flavus]|uniref:hypothetical protein n=1 Tax=Chthoniobacter flavus TaxID=191863 RepID=UPI0012FAA062|nr:hypothetical protein [Chthoniobacter flavus]
MNSPKAGLLGGRLIQASHGIALFIPQSAPPFLRFAFRIREDLKALLSPAYFNRTRTDLISTATNPGNANDFHRLTI